MDDLLITIIVVGIGLSIAYLRAELVRRQELKATQGKGNSPCVNCTSQDRAVNTLPSRFKQILSGR
jgi:hypothetical protein